MPDHAVMFSNLTTQLSDRVTHHIVTLKSKDCPNVKATMSNIVSQLMENVSLVSLEFSAAMKVFQTGPEFWFYNTSR